MYLIYVDESGDPGLKTGSTDFFIISGVIIHESDWNDVMQEIVEFRKLLSKRFGLPQRVAFHATEIVNGHGDFHYSKYGLVRKERMRYYWYILNFISKIDRIKIINLCVTKDWIKFRNVDVFEKSWTYFIQRFHNSISKGGATGHAGQFGLLFTDRTHDTQLRKLMRRMRAFNLVPSQYSGSPSRPQLVNRILDDPIPRESPHSYFVQLADMVAFALARKMFPRPGLKPFKFETFFDLLDPVLLKEASPDPQGIVFWPKEKPPPS